MQWKIHVLGDALSRIPQVNNCQHSKAQVSIASFHNTLQDNYNSDQFFSPILKALKGNFPDDEVATKKLKFILPNVKYVDRILYFKDLVCVPRKNVKDLLRLAHDCPLGGHFSFLKTLSRLEKYHWNKKYTDIKRYCLGCSICQQAKDSRSKPFGIPQPLELPTRRWGSIGTDFITGLPKTASGHDAITTYIDRFSKRVHFLATSSTASAETVAKDFYCNIFKLHGLPDSIVADRDPRFTSRFWTALMRICDVQLKMSTSHHPQTDGCSEITNPMIENFVRCFCSLNQTAWDELLPAAEFSYNSAVVENLNMSPFELDLGWNPKSPVDLFARPDSSVAAVTDLKKRLNSAAADASFSHLLAQARQQAYDSKRYVPPSYNIDDKVWLSRKYFTDAVSKTQTSRKLGVQRYGPFRVTELIGKNAIRLELPPNIKIHPVVHVEHTSRVYTQPPDIRQPLNQRPPPIPQADGSSLI